MSIDTSAEAVARDAQDLRRLAQYFSEEHSTSDCRFSKMAARMDALAAERDALKAQVRAHAMSSTARDLADEMMNEKTDALIAQRDAALAEVARLRENIAAVVETKQVVKCVTNTAPGTDKSADKSKHQFKPTEKPEGYYSWKGQGPAPAHWYAPDGTKVYRSYGDYVDD